jgi:hypothetical protein
MPECSAFDFLRGHHSSVRSNGGKPVSAESMKNGFPHEKVGVGCTSCTKNGARSAPYQTMPLKSDDKNNGSCFCKKN